MEHNPTGVVEVSTNKDEFVHFDGNSGRVWWKGDKLLWAI
jgi:hypothetical protein